MLNLETKIKDVTNLGHKINGDVYITTDAGNGWIVLKDSPQDLRIWAYAAAIWAAKRTGKEVNATLHFDKFVKEPDDKGKENSQFIGVERIQLLP